MKNKNNTEMIFKNRTCPSKWQRFWLSSVFFQSNYAASNLVTGDWENSFGGYIPGDKRLVW